MLTSLALGVVEGVGPAAKDRGEVSGPGWTRKLDNLGASNPLWLVFSVFCSSLFRVGFVMGWRRQGDGGFMVGAS